MLLPLLMEEWKGMYLCGLLLVYYYYEYYYYYYHYFQ